MKQAIENSDSNLQEKSFISDISQWENVMRSIQLAFVSEDPEDIPESSEIQHSKLLIQV